MKNLSGWGRFPVFAVNETTPSTRSELISLLKEQNTKYIARGNGRSYGDSSINQSLTITMTKLNRFIDWNEDSGELVAESGVLMSDVIKTFLPLGWFPYVTPGTKFVTLGGAIASDVHGKNHHLEGSFGNHVNWIEIIDETNQVLRCSKTENTELFNWTIGGMGLTGIITKCCIRLKKVETGWINQRTIVNNTLRETLNSFDDNHDSIYSVAWIDCLSKGKNFGRSLLFTGEHATLNEVDFKNIYPRARTRMFSLLFDLPSFLLNNFTVAIFNYLYFLKNSRKLNQLVDWDKYFYPLDTIRNWNRLYGRKGFFQFQCILPIDKSYIGLQEILSKVQKDSSGSFLAVLKKFGPGNGNLSFPRPGYTLALDFKATYKNISLARKITDIVKNYNGAIYLSKDALMNEEDFASFINSDLKEQLKLISNKNCSSEQSKRINL